MADHRQFTESFPEEFLRLLFGDVLGTSAYEIELRCIAKNKPVVRRFFRSIADFRKFWPTVVKLNRQKYNVFIGVLPRNRMNRKPAQPTLLTCLWADLDLGPDKTEKVLHRVTRCVALSNPTVTVHSGHGLHVYYLLHHPTRTDIKGAKMLLRALASRLKGDLQSAEPARLLRAPNTRNWKNEKNPTTCRILRLRSDRHYSCIEIAGPLYFPRLKQMRSDAHDDFFKFYGRHVAKLCMTGEHQAIGLCPFHDDHEPSFSLRVGDGVWHCFGCGRSGNALTFCLMQKIDLTECPKAARLQEHNALAIENGAYFIWRRQSGGWTKRRISNFVLDWDEENRVSDKIRLEDRVFRGTLLTTSKERIPIRFSTDDLCSNARFYTQLILEAGTKISLREHDAGNIRMASFLFSKPRQVTSSMDFGFRDDNTFYTPTLVITAEGIHPAANTVVGLSSIEHARHLELKKLSDDEVKGVLRHMRDDLLRLHPESITHPVLGFLGAAPLMYFMEDTTRYRRG